MDKRLPFLSTLELEAREWLAGRFLFQRHDPGARIFSTGDKPVGLYYFVSGRAMLTAPAEDGASVFVDIVSSGNLIGVAPLLKGDPYLFTCQPVTRTEIAILPASDFFRAREQHWCAFYRWCEDGMMTELLRISSHCAHIATSKSARADLMLLLLRAGGYEGNGDPPKAPYEVPRALTTAVNAGAINTSRTTVHRELAQLLEAGVLVRKKPRSLWVEQPKRLWSMLRAELKVCC